MSVVIGRLVLIGLAALLLGGPQVRAEKVRKVLMWRAVSPTATVYLLGTLHLARPDLYPLDRAITRAFKRSRVLALEADVSPDALLKIGPQILFMMVYPAGKTLETELSPPTWKSLRTYARRSGLDLASHQKFRPWLVSMLLAIKAMKKLGYSEKYGLDTVLLKRARAAGKKVAYLETALEQLKLLADMTPPQQDAFLAQTLREMAHLKRVMDFMVRAWQQGDAPALKRYLLHLRRLMKDPLVGPVFRRIIDHRNKNMAAAARKFLAGKRTVMIAVGTMHLVGRRGVVSLLQRQGFKVVQVEARGRPSR